MKEQKTLAQFIYEQREKRGLSTQGLAKKAAVELSEIEDIEAGQVLFLPSTIRQKLARALRLNPFEIKEYEKTIEVITTPDEKYIEELKKIIINGTYENLLCPVCHSALVTKVEEMYDLDDNLVLHPKAHCSKCTFQIK